MVELSKHVKIKDYSIIIIDDGIASGNTSAALAVLLKCAGVKVVGAFFFRHTYMDCVYNSVPIYTVFTLRLDSQHMQHELVFFAYVIKKSTCLAFNDPLIILRTYSIES